MPSLPSAFDPATGGPGEGYMATVYPPSQNLDLSIEAISGITGSVSIACWLVVFTPQIIENFRRQSAEGLSLTFLILWLLGDIFNVLGAILQGVIPTMLILAIYYTFADIVLLIQCFYYRSFGAKPAPEAPIFTNGHSHTDGPRDPLDPTEDSPLLSRTISDYGVQQLHERRRSSIRSLADCAHHLSPANPLHTLPPSPEGSIHKFLYAPATNGHKNGHTNGTNGTNGESSSAMGALLQSQAATSPASQSNSALWKAIYRNTIAVSLVIFAGVAGYYFAPPKPRPEPGHPEHRPLEFNFLGQVFGYLCAVLYLGSRIPQIVLNYQRKSCEGIAFLFFLFACLGNVTYVISILAYRPGKVEDGEGYWRYIGVNASWLLGSVGTLGLDFLIFVQFFLYRVNEDEERESALLSGEDDYLDDERTLRPSA